MSYKPVFICDTQRTPIGRYGGALSSIRADDLASLPITALMNRNTIDWTQLDEVILGAANQSGEDNRNIARMAVLLSGLPETVPGMTVNRLCASGLDAVIVAARKIQTGEANLVIAGGSESMSRAPFAISKSSSAFARNVEIHDTTIGWRFVNERISQTFGIDSMPETAENVAEEYAISREDQDKLALLSQTRAKTAIDNGVLSQEIVPVALPQRKGAPIIFDQDEHPRQTSIEKLGELPAPFRKHGSVTAGNSSGINDGAAALLLASEDAIKQYDLKPLARFEDAATAGVQPRVMGIGPVFATQKLCTRLGVAAADFDLIELNEAFAAQTIAVCRELGLDPFANNINPRGGAIALGHPLGMTGTRLAGAAARSIFRGEAKHALVSLCVGVGQGVSLSLSAV
jgi:acetyl-CoA acyltransferase